MQIKSVSNIYRRPAVVAIRFAAAIGGKPAFGFTKVPQHKYYLH
jgi:hypothetical protein